LHEVTEYDIKLVKSPVPYISAGTSWLVWALFFPLYLWYHFIIAALISAGIYLFTSKLFPAKQVKIPQKHRIELSGDAEVDRQIKSARDNVKKIETSVKIIESIHPAVIHLRFR
jgi:hypothetical protein